MRNWFNVAPGIPFGSVPLNFSMCKDTENASEFIVGFKAEFTVPVVDK